VARADPDRGDALRGATALLAALQPHAHAAAAAAPRDA
jgi:hypothetical protein